MRAMRRRRTQCGQSLIEMALLAPFLIVLMAGSAQVGVIAYGSVTADTAAREGARVASERPVNATSFPGVSATFSGCQPIDVASNYAVQAVCNNLGILDSSKVTVTITKNVDVTALAPRPAYRLVGAPVMPSASCSASYMVVSGTVSGIPAGQTAYITTDQDLSINLAVPSATPTYSYCFPNVATQTLFANVGTACSGAHDSATIGMNVSTVNFTLVANAPCDTLITTTTALTPASTTVAQGQSTTLTATVTPNTGTAAPTGSATFYDGATPLGMVTLGPSGAASLSTPATLAPGSHSITAVYNPDPSHVGSASNAATVTVTATGIQSTTTSLSATPASAQQGTTFTFTATVSAGATGTVSFTDTFNGTFTSLGAAPLDATGKAVISTTSLAAGTHPVFASYSGDPTHGVSQSATQSVTVTVPTTGGPPPPPPIVCTDPPTGLTSMYLQMDVTYPVPVFVPFISGLFTNSGGNRNVTITQVIRIEPCGITQGQ